MNILIVTQYFYPENFKSNDIAFELSRRGHKVEAIVGIPNYPKGNYYKGYGIFKKRIEVINGVKIYRTFQFPRKNSRAIYLILNYLSFVFSSSIRIIYFALFKKYDCIIIHEPSPIFQAIPAIIYKKIKKIPIYLWILDLWPDAMMSGGGVRNKFILTLVDKIVVWVYSNCNILLISSLLFKESILKKGDYNSKIIYFPNWSDDLKQDKIHFPIPNLPEGFKIMLAGNLGKSQDLESIGKLILELKDIQELKWVFVGDGSEKNWLINFIKSYKLEDSVFYYGSFPKEAMPTFYNNANAMLVTLKSGFYHLSLVVPARLQSYMSAGRPVLGMIGKGAAEIIKTSNCGYSVDSGEYRKLAEIIKNDVLINKKAFENKGANGRFFYERNYTLKKCIDHLEIIIKH